MDEAWEELKNRMIEKEEDYRMTYPMSLHPAILNKAEAYRDVLNIMEEIEEKNIK